MNKINRGTGAGGSRTNLNGINFEEKVYLYDWIKSRGYRMEQYVKGTSRSSLYKIYSKEEDIIAWYGRQGQIYNALKEMLGKVMSNEYIKEVLSKKINPDAFILSKRRNTLTIFEKKWQQVGGSVDEKIQTAPFKLEMFKKLLRNTNLKISYQYILSSWFNQPQYRNVMEYYKNNDSVKIWIENKNLFNLVVDDYI